MVSSSETRLQALFAQLHEDEVDGEAMQPGGEGGFAAEAAELAEEVEEGLLGHVLGFGDVAEHAQAEGVDAAFVQRVELGEGLGVAVLGGFDGFGFAGDGRVALEEAGVRFVCRHGSLESLAWARFSSSFVGSSPVCMSAPDSCFQALSQTTVERFVTESWIEMAMTEVKVVCAAVDALDVRCADQDADEAGVEGAGEGDVGGALDDGAAVGEEGEGVGSAAEAEEEVVGAEVLDVGVLGEAGCAWRRGRWGGGARGSGRSCGRRG